MLSWILTSKVGFRQPSQMKNINKRQRFPPSIIQYAVWLYYRFNLSVRDVEDLLAERNISVSYEAIRLWINKFGPEFTRRLRRRVNSGPKLLREMTNVDWSKRLIGNPGETFPVTNTAILKRARFIDSGSLPITRQSCFSCIVLRSNRSRPRNTK